MIEIEEVPKFANSFRGISSKNTFLLHMIDLITCKEMFALLWYW